MFGLSHEQASFLQKQSVSELDLMFLFGSSQVRSQSSSQITCNIPQFTTHNSVSNSSPANRRSNRIFFYSRVFPPSYILPTNSPSFHILFTFLFNFLILKHSARLLHLFVNNESSPTFC